MTNPAAATPHSDQLANCIQCGRCSGSCPVALKSHLNVRRFVYQGLTDALPEHPETCPEIWECTSCTNCNLRCPKQVDPLDVILDLRGRVVEAGRVAPSVRDCLESTFKHGNPWSMPREKRTDWTAGHDVPDFAGQEFALFVCCTTAYDPRGRKLIGALVRVLARAGVTFGILGRDESCCGHEIKRLGEVGLFEMLVEDNRSLFTARGVRRLLTVSPHCYNALKNDYGLAPGTVEHYDGVLLTAFERGRLTVGRALDRRVVYHDPCCLGKQNEVYDRPRALLGRLPGIELIEFDRARERSVCCEGGGGRMWSEGEGVSAERLAEARVREAIELGADILATSCPFCVLTFEDALKTTNLDDKLVVRDITELADQATSQGE